MTPGQFRGHRLQLVVGGVATIRAGVYPRVAAWVLLVATILALVPFPLANLPFYAAVAWIGLDLLGKRAVSSRGRRNKPRR
jgi:hypothetical protein